MRILMAALAVTLLLSGSAQAQGTANWPQHRKAANKPVNQAKKKAAEKAYKDALKKIPNASAPNDPWKGVR